MEDTEKQENKHEPKYGMEQCYIDGQPVSRKHYEEYMRTSTWQQSDKKE